MYHSEDVIRQLQSQNVLAMKLDRAVRAVGEEVKQHVSNIGAGAQRLLYYTSCLTDEYYDVCTKQHLEDSRFRKGIVHLVTRRNIVSEMTSAYVEEMVKDFSPDQLAEIQRILMYVNVYISTSSLTSYAFATGVATAISLHVTLPLSGLKAAAGLTSAVVGSLGVYGIVQHAAESARRLQIQHPACYQMLYFREIEMMYFLVEPIFMRAGVLSQQWTDGHNVPGVADKIIRLMGKQ